MVFDDFLSHFEVTGKSGDEYKCICPAHNDKKASLCIKQDNGKILIKCHAKCRTEDVVAAAGLSMKDLFLDVEGKNGRSIWEKIDYGVIKNLNYKDLSDTDRKTFKRMGAYDYHAEDGSYLYTRIRYEGKVKGNRTKEFRYRKIDYANGTWSSKLGDTKKTLYKLPELIKALKKNETIFIPEGEKDVETLMSKGFTATTPGGANDWDKRFSKYFEGANVIILPDNDEPGIKLRNVILNDIRPLVNSVKCLITSKAEHGDITDYFSEGHTVEEFKALIDSETPVQDKPNDSINGYDYSLTKMSEIEEKEVEWLIPGWIPKDVITIIGGDGGEGKTFIWTQIAAAISSGKIPGFMNFPFPVSFGENERNVVYFSGEDEADRVLKKRLRLSGATMENISTIRLGDERFKDIYLGSERLENFIRHNKPSLLIFDPLQSFLADHVQMERRNQMRHALQHLSRWGSEFGVTSIIIAHSNKREAAAGRSRLADSADIFDIARSVIMVGGANERNLFYFSQEKNSYDKKQDTILYSIEDGKVVNKGFSDKKEADFKAEKGKQQNSGISSRDTAKAEARNSIEETLKDCGEMEIKTLDKSIKDLGFSINVVREARRELEKMGQLKSRKESGGKSGGVINYISLATVSNGAAESCSNLKKC